ncbi:MAG: hypothetical protein U0787_20520 [Polyangia bacterium]
MASRKTEKVLDAVQRHARSVRLVADGLLDKYHPLLVQIVPMRRCNLTCAYCNEYDRTFAGSASDRKDMRIARLAELRSASGYDKRWRAFLHPELMTFCAAFASME